MKKQRSNEYFEGFVSGMESACKAAEYLENLVEHFDSEKLYMFKCLKTLFVRCLFLKKHNNV